MVKARTAAKKLVLSSTLVALVVALSPIYFVWGPTKALPWQHMVNVIAGIVLGPLWAAAVAFLAGTIRIVLGTGTIFAYPGGIPGGLVVGLTYSLLSKISKRRKAVLAISSLTEPLGTCGLGGTITWYLLDPLLGGVFRAKFGVFLYFAAGWLASSVIGAALGLLIVLSLEKLSMLGGSGWAGSRFS
jgi:energy coupling factor transporter S component ThiW